MANETQDGPVVQADKVGFVVTAQEMEAQDIFKVQTAATAAGFDSEIVREIKPRNAFIRAARQLVKQGVIEAGNKGVLADKISDESDVAYQFSARQVSGGEARYNPQAVIRFNKKSETITVEGLHGVETHKQVYETVMKLFKQAGFTYTSTDMNNMTDRLYAEVTRKVMLRPAVYFIPVTFQALVFKVRKFFDVLGIKYHVLTIGTSEAWAVKDVFEATVQDVMKQMKSLRAEIAGTLAAKNAGNEDGALTPRMARNRIKELAVQLGNYRTIAGDLRVKLDQVLAEAGQDGKTLAAVASGPTALIQALNAGRPVDPLAAILADTADGGSGRILALAAKVNGKAPQVAVTEAVALSTVPAQHAGAGVPLV